MSETKSNISPNRQLKEIDRLRRRWPEGSTIVFPNGNKGHVCGYCVSGTGSTSLVVEWENKDEPLEFVTEKQMGVKV